MLIKYITLQVPVSMPFDYLARELRIGLEDTDDFDAKLVQNIKISKFKNLRALPPVFSNFSLKKFVFS